MDQACTATGLHHALPSQDGDRADRDGKRNESFLIIPCLCMDETENSKEQQIKIVRKPPT